MEKKDIVKMTAKYSNDPSLVPEANFTQSGAASITAALPHPHQGDVIYIMRCCHGNKAPVSMGVGVSGWWIPRCFPNMHRCECTAANAVTRALTNICSEPG